MKHYRDNRTKKTFCQIAENATVVVYDTETTGLDRTKDDVIQFAAQKYQINDSKWILLSELNLLINPGYPIPPEVTEINHISNEDVKDAPTLKEAFPAIQEIMDADFWCGHNIIGFDNRFMQRIYEINRAELPEGYFYSLDTLDAVVDLVNRKDCGKYNLGSMCQYFSIEESKEGTAGFHDALYDVRQCAKLAQTVHQMYLTDPGQPDEGYVNSGLKPVIYSVKEWKAFKGAYTTGNYFLITTDCGRFRYDRYNQVWSGEKEKPVSYQAVIEATYDKLGLHSDHDLVFWKEKPEEKLPGAKEYESHPENWPINFGKYKGQTLGSIVQTAEGRDYLKYMVTSSDWMNDEKRKNEKAAIKAVLGC